MKEITRITTVELTSIAKVNDESELIAKEELKKCFEKGLKAVANCDDVKVLNMQDFIRDV